MLYSTIVDKNEEGLRKIIDAAEKFEEGRYLDAIHDCHLKKEDILEVTEFVREYRAKLSREHLALARFALSFNRKYATENNKCFDTGEKLFGKIRSTISASKKIYKRFCRTVRKPMPAAAASQRPSVFTRSELAKMCYSGQLFGMESYDECVARLYEQLEGFFMELVKCLALCRMIISEESSIRNAPERCMKIYRESYDEILSNTRMMVRTFKESKVVPDSEFDDRRKNAGSLPDFICSNFHTLDPSQFQMHVVVSELMKSDGMTNVEKILFGADNMAMAEKARLVVRHFDELEKDAHKGKHKDKHSAYCVASFMLWCGLGQNGNVKFFVENYFNQTYKGEYPPVKTNAVNSAKNVLQLNPEESNLDNALFHAKIDSLVEKYASKDEVRLHSAANF